MKNITVKTGTYKNKAGEEKGTYETIGNLIETQDGKICIKFKGLTENFLKQLFGYKWEGRANVYDDDKKDKEKEVIDEGLPF